MIIDLQKAQTFYVDFYRAHENDPKALYQTIENKKFHSGKHNHQSESRRPVILSTPALIIVFRKHWIRKNSMLRKFQISNLVKFLSFYLGTSCSSDLNEN